MPVTRRKKIRRLVFHKIDRRTATRAVRRLNHEINTGLASLTLKSGLAELWHNPNGRFGYELRN